MRILLPLVQFASVSLAQNDCAHNFSQCNGQHWPYSVCCIDPAFTCQVVTPYLSLCVPKPVPVVEIGPWGQCGGLAWGGPTACSNDWQCQVVNPYYSQCVPPYPTQPPATPGTPAPTGITTTPATTNASSDIDCYDDVQDETGVLSPDDVANTSNITLAPGAIVAAYGQCGGYTYVGSNICVQGYYCQAANDWYSQCVPIPNLPGLPTYSQCGGYLWTGPTDCQAGTTCTELNAWYSQCLPF